MYTSLRESNRTCLVSNVITKPFFTVLEFNLVSYLYFFLLRPVLHPIFHLSIIFSNIKNTNPLNNKSFIIISNLARIIQIGYYNIYV